MGKEDWDNIFSNEDSQPDQTEIKVSPVTNQPRQEPSPRPIAQPRNDGLGAITNQLKKQSQEIADLRAELNSKDEMEAIGEKVSNLESATSCPECGVVFKLEKGFRKAESGLIVDLFGEDEPKFKCPCCRKEFAQVTLLTSDTRISAKTYFDQLESNENDESEKED